MDFEKIYNDSNKSLKESAGSDYIKTKDFNDIENKKSQLTKKVKMTDLNTSMLTDIIKIKDKYKNLGLTSEDVKKDYEDNLKVYPQMCFFIKKAYEMMIEGLKWHE